METTPKRWESLHSGSGEERIAGISPFPRVDNVTLFGPIFIWYYRDSSPKNENSVIIYSPSSSSKPVWMCLFCRTQRKIFWRKFVTRLFWGTIDFYDKKYYGSQWCPRTALFPTFFRISSFVFSRTKTFIQVWNYLRVSKWWQNFHFWVNYSFNVCLGWSDYKWLTLKTGVNSGPGVRFPKASLANYGCKFCRYQ